MARAKASEQTAITSAARRRLAGCGCGENLGAFFSDWLSGAFFDAAADGVCFLVAGAAAQRWYTSRISSGPFGRAKYASSFAKSAIGWSPSDAIHFEVKSRSGAGIACPDVSTWSMRARRCTESTWPKAKSVPDLDAPFCSEEDVGRVGRLELASVRNKCRTRRFHNCDGLEPGDRDAPERLPFRASAVRRSRSRQMTCRTPVRACLRPTDPGPMNLPPIDPAPRSCGHVSKRLTQPRTVRGGRPTLRPE